MSDLPRPRPPTTPPPPPPPRFTPRRRLPATRPTARRPPQLDYAGFGARLGGWLLDGLIMILFFVPAIVALARRAPPRSSRARSTPPATSPSAGELNALCEGPTDGTIAIAGLLGLIGLVGVFVYQAKLLGGPTGADARA